MADLDAGWITAIVLGAVLLCLVVIIIIWVVYNRKKYGDLAGLVPTEENAAVESEMMPVKSADQRWEELIRRHEQDMTERHQKRHEGGRKSAETEMV